MPTWHETVASSLQAAPTPGSEATRRWPWLERTPIVISGAPGAGKTELWRRMTGREAARARSLVRDEGYIAPTRQRRYAMTITTVPGQPSLDRYLAMSELFGGETVVRGVVFVASYGYDHIWPRDAEVVSNGLPDFSLSALRDRSVEHEITHFQELCGKIREKFTLAPEHRCPDWLLVLVNKMDLYVDDSDEAARYYLPLSGSRFDRVAQSLLTDIGAMRLTYSVVPVASTNEGFYFSSNRGVLSVPSRLNKMQCEASQRSAVLTLEELCE